MTGPLGLSPFEAITHVASNSIYVWLPGAQNETDGLSIIDELSGKGRWVRVSFLTTIPSLVDAAQARGIEWVRNWNDLASRALS